MAFTLFRSEFLSIFFVFFFLFFASSTFFSNFILTLFALRVFCIVSARGVLAYVHTRTYLHIVPCWWWWFVVVFPYSRLLLLPSQLFPSIHFSCTPTVGTASNSSVLFEWIVRCEWWKRTRRHERISKISVSELCYAVHVWICRCG